MKVQILAFVLLLFFLSSFSGCLSDSDRDNDGLPDNIEGKGWSVYVTYIGENVRKAVHVTSSTHKKDTDGDGLTDYEEIIVYGTDPLHWADDIDRDNVWWNGDYEEIEYYRGRGIDDATIRQFLNNSDVDGDGIKDGNDIDPLSDLEVRITIEGVKVTSDMDDNDDLLETVFDIVTDGESNSSTMIYVPVGVNYSVNMSFNVDLNDMGIPGEYNNSISLDVIDEDKGLERKPLDVDGFPGMDVVKIAPSGGYAINDFNINSDCRHYHLSGTDGEIWFSIEDVSTPWS